MKRDKILFITIIAILPYMVYAQNFGQNEHPMNSRSDNVDVLKYWNNQSSDELKTYETIYQVLSKNKDATYADLINKKEYLELYKHNNLYLLGGPILGDVKATGISIWFRTGIPSKVQVELTSDNKAFKSDYVHTSSESDLSGIIKINGLNPATVYSYTLLINDTNRISNGNYFFKTVPNQNDAFPLRIAFGSCPHRWGLGNEKLLNTIKQRDPAAMLLLGDIAVQDRNNHLGLHRADYLLRDFQVAWKNFASNVPVYASWDDHDYFGNDKVGIPPGYSDKDRRNVREVFKNSWLNPAYGSNDEGIYFKTQIGFVEVVMTDNRYFRGDPMYPFLGQSQMEWLKTQIKRCKSPFLVLSSGTMWIDYVSDGKDSWGINDPKGREEIFKLIEQNKISAVLLISGDRHGARGFTIQRDSGFELFEFGAASLGARVGPPKSKPEWVNQIYGIDGTFAFGEFTFEKKKNKENVIFRLINETGNILYERQFLTKELKSK